MFDLITRYFADVESAVLAGAPSRLDEGDWRRRDVVDMPPPMVIAAREDIAEQLWLHGEEELSVRMLDTDDATWQRVMQVAVNPSQLRGRSSATVDFALTRTGPSVGPARRTRGVARRSRAHRQTELPAALLGGGAGGVREPLRDAPGALAVGGVHGLDRVTAGGGLFYPLLPALCALCSLLHRA